MLTLALDTSGDICSVAVADAAKGLLLSEYSFAHNRRLTERLPGIVDFVLKDAGVTLETIDAFAVGLGPGSFTGVRVGVTMAKVWAEVLGKPLYGMSSLEAMAEMFGCWADRVVVAFVPSRSGEVIAEAFDQGGSISGPMVVETSRLEEWGRKHFEEARRTDVSVQNIYFVSEHPKIVSFPCVAVFPSAAWIAKCFMIGELVDPATLSPLYVAPPPIRTRTEIVPA
jgi:tRNA threonylcarbamoyladenosine biosynthesis protein TsaB